METEFKKIELEIGWDNHFKALTDISPIHQSEVGGSIRNKSLNRYLDVTPYDHSRVKLTRAKDTDYINANIVTVPKAARQYILTQGPLPETISHFWLMVWEQKSNVIVMLNRVVELENFVKCEPYWPKSVGSTDNYKTVGLSVTLDSVQDKKHYSIRFMTIRDLETKNSERKISQYYYTAWPDHGSPESPTSLLRLLTAIRKSGGLDKMDEPAVVHCSAGIGRSGTFCLIDSILSIVENQGSTEGIDIDATLIDMRNYRKGLIQSAIQLRFAYLSIIYGIKILEKADKLHHHISSSKAAIAIENPSKGTDQEGILKKTRKSKRKGSKTSAIPSSINIFQKHLLVDALNDIDSDTADNLFYDMMKPWPSFKKARNDDFSDDESPLDRPPMLKLGDVKLCDSPGLKSPSGLDSSLLRRREKNQRIAERTTDIKTRMKEEEAKRERNARRMLYLKRSVIYSGIAAIVISSMVYSYMRIHGSL